MKKITIITLLASTALAAIFLGACSSQPEGIQISITAPEQVSSGELFDVTVTIENGTDEIQELMSIDFDTNYLEGISMINSTPAYADAWDFSLMEIMSYNFESDIPPGQSMEVDFHMTGILEGSYKGSIDVCVTTEQECWQGTLSTKVE